MSLAILRFSENKGGPFESEIEMPILVPTFIKITMECAYDKVAVNLKQFRVLDEISRKVMYPFFFASGWLILMHRTHFIQNI